MNRGAIATACSIIFFSAANASTIVLAPVADNSIYQGPDSAATNGGGDHIYSGVNRGGEIRRALLRFDLSAIPAGSTINAVSLRLVCTRQIVGEPAMTLHRLVNSWGEGVADAEEPGGQGTTAAPGDATWLFRFFGSDAWAAPGGDFIAAASAGQTVSGLGPYDWSSAGLAADVQAWLDSAAPNHGWILLGDESSSFNAKRFGSRENPLISDRPTLTIDFTPPPSCPGDADGNGVVTFADVSFILANWGNPFGFADVTVTLANWNAVCP